MGTGEILLGLNPAMDEHPIRGGVAILLVASCYRNWDKLRPCGPPWLVCDLTYTFIIVNLQGSESFNITYLFGDLSRPWYVHLYLFFVFLENLERPSVKRNWTL